MSTSRERTPFTRCPVSRPGWRATGATNCTHISGAMVWLPGLEDRWVYWVPGESENLLEAHRIGRTRNYATRDDAMAAAEAALAEPKAVQ